MIYNTEEIHMRDFGDKTIVRESVTVNRQFDPHKTQWVQSWLRADKLEDETSLIDIGL